MEIKGPLDLQEKVVKAIMVGALAGTNLLPLSRESFEEAIRESLPSRAAENLKAFAYEFEKTYHHPLQGGSPS